MSRGFQTAEVNWISCNGIVAPGAQNVKSERCRSGTCFVGGGIFFRAPGHTDREYTAKEMEAYAGDRPYRADPCDHRRAQLGQHRSVPVRSRGVDLRRAGLRGRPRDLHARGSGRDLVHFPALPRPRRNRRRHGGGIMPRQQKNGMADAMLFFSPMRTASLGPRWNMFIQVSASPARCCPGSGRTHRAAADTLPARAPARRRAGRRAC